MGISVPIGAEHYQKLKIISDKLDFGLKKTIEYLVTYYWQKEVQPNVVETKVITSLKEIMKELGKETVASTQTISAPTSIPKPASVIAPPSKFQIQNTILPPKKIVIPPPKTTALGSPPQIVATNSILKDQNAISKLVKPMITSTKTTTQNCSACGTPKRTNVKYCYNCGNLL